MSEPKVYVNGQKAGEWAYGYTPFSLDISSLVHDGENTIYVELQNLPQSARWYPGAGLYRNIHLIVTERVHIPVWGTCITTPYVGNDYASVCLRTEIEGIADGDMCA